MQLRKNSRRGTKPGPIQPEPPALHQILNLGAFPLSCDCHIQEGERHLYCMPGCWCCWAACRARPGELLVISSLICSRLAACLILLEAQPKWTDCLCLISQ